VRTPLQGVGDDEAIGGEADAPNRLGDDDRVDALTWSASFAISLERNAL
jgi:hypothetical protein